MHGAPPALSHSRPPVAWWLGGLLVLLAVGAAALLQAHGRAAQQVDIGGPLDQGVVHYVGARETSASGPATTFRWTQRWSLLELWPVPPALPAWLSLRMLAPPQPDGPQRVRVSLRAPDETTRPVADLALSSDLRTYHMLLPPRAGPDLTLVLESEPLLLVGESRELGVSLDALALLLPTAPWWQRAAAELTLAPLLPLTLLAAGGALLVLGVSSLRVGLGSLLALAMVWWAGRLLPGSALVLAAYLSLLAAVLAGSALLLLALRRWPALRPESDRRALLWLALAFGLLFGLLFDPRVNSDGVGYYAYLRSLTMDGDLHFANEYTHISAHYTRPPGAMPATPTGLVSNPWSVGPALLWAPFYALAHLLVVAGNLAGLPWLADGFARPYVALTMAGSALAGWALLLLGYHICRRFVAPGPAVLGVLGVMLGSNVLFYVLREGSFAHALAAALAGLFVLAWLRLEEQPSVERWAQLGGAAGLLIVVYWIGALLLVLPLLTAARLLWGALRAPSGTRLRRLGRLGLGGLLAAVLALGLVWPQLLAWRVIYGAWLTVPQGAGYINPGGVVWGEFLFSNLRGLLPWTPALFVGLAGLLLLVRRAPWRACCLLLAAGLYVWYNASIANWHGSGAFGLRRLTLLAAWAMLGLALVVAWLARWHRLLPLTLVGLMGSWVTLLLVRHHMFWLPHDAYALFLLPEASFYFSRTALPVAHVPVLVSDSYFWGGLVRAFSTANALEALVLVFVVAGGGLALGLTGFGARHDRGAR